MLPCVCVFGQRGEPVGLLGADLSCSLERVQRSFYTDSFDWGLWDAARRCSQESWCSLILK